MMLPVLDERKLGRKTRAGQLGNIRKHVTPLRGRYRINDDRVDEDLLDACFAELARCRDHGTGGPSVRHWTSAMNGASATSANR